MNCFRKSCHLHPPNSLSLQSKPFLIRPTPSPPLIHYHMASLYRFTYFVFNCLTYWPLWLTSTVKQNYYTIEKPSGQRQGILLTALSSKTELTTFPKIDRRGLPYPVGRSFRGPWVTILASRSTPIRRNLPSGFARIACCGTAIGTCCCCCCG